MYLTLGSRRGLLTAVIELGAAGGVALSRGCFADKNPSSIIVAAGIFVVGSVFRDCSCGPSHVNCCETHWWYWHWHAQYGRPFVNFRDQPVGHLRLTLTSGRIQHHVVESLMPSRSPTAHASYETTWGLEAAFCASDGACLWT